jgi:hypothetical protein
MAKPEAQPGEERPKVKMPLQKSDH